MEKGIVRRWLGLSLSVLLWGGACHKPADAPRGTSPGDVVLPSVPPVKVLISPPPGTYSGYTLDVTITSDDPSAALYYSLISSATTQGRRYSKKINVRLLHSGVVNVMARSPAGGVAEASFEYRLVSTHPHGACQVQEFPKSYYRANEPINAVVQFTLPNALAVLELIVDGVARTVAPSDFVGVEEFSIGAFAANGAHTVGCRIRESSTSIVEGGGATLSVDGLAPIATWLKGGGAFTHENWDGVFRLQVQDFETGVAGVQLCAADACYPFQSVGNDVYVFATAVTLESSFSSTLSVTASDMAGNVAVIPDLTLDLSNFFEPPASPVMAIPVTVSSSLNLSAILGASAPSRNVSEVVSFGLAASYSPASVPLQAGWNDFLYRQAGHTEWESYSIYRAGAAVALPAVPLTSNWLVFASRSRVPLFAGEKVDEIAGSPAGSVWRSGAFELPHLWFVEDTNADHVWDSYEPVYKVSGDTYQSSWLALSAPVDTNVNRVLSFALPATAMVEIDCPVATCALPGQLLFSSRVTNSSAHFAWQQFGPPVTHVTYSIASFPVWITVPVSAGADCFFHWDEVRDGELNPSEPRAWGPCDQGAQFSLGLKQGSLAVQPLVYASLNYASVTGIPYGGEVTGSLELLAADQSLLLAVPLDSIQDDDGLGAQVMQVPVTFYVPSRIRIWDGVGEGASQNLGWGVYSASGVKLYTVTVTDETGASVETVVRTGVGELPSTAEQIYSEMSVGALTLTDGGGVASVSVPLGETAPDFTPVHSGYLGVSAVDATSTSVHVQLLSPAVTGLLFGTVQDNMGRPVPNVSLMWTSGRYVSQILSAKDGGYALPASGGTGTLAVSAPGVQRSRLQYSLAVTREMVNFDVQLTLPVTGTVSADWPEGMGGDPALPILHGPYAAPLLVKKNAVYAAPLTSGAWSAGFYEENVFRDFAMPGALPASPQLQGGVFNVNGNLPTLVSEARCGAYRQPVVTGAVVDSNCWSWFASDGLETYYLGRLSPVFGFPEALGLHEIGGTLSTSLYLPALDQTLYLQDRLLGRTLRVSVSGGAFSAVVPSGIYEVRTQTGTQVSRDGLPAVIRTDTGTVSVNLVADP